MVIELQQYTSCILEFMLGDWALKELYQSLQNKQHISRQGFSLQRFVASCSNYLDWVSFFFKKYSSQLVVCWILHNWSLRSGEGGKKMCFINSLLIRSDLHFKACWPESLLHIQISLKYPFTFWTHECQIWSRAQDEWPLQLRLMREPANFIYHLLTVLGVMGSEFWM